MTELERSHADLRAALILAGRELKKLQFGSRNSPLPDKLRSVLKEVRVVARAERQKVRVKLWGEVEGGSGMEKKATGSPQMRYRTLDYWPVPGTLTRYRQLSSWALSRISIKSKSAFSASVIAAMYFVNDLELSIDVYLGYGIGCGELATRTNYAPTKSLRSVSMRSMQTMPRTDRIAIQRTH